MLEETLHRFRELGVDVAHVRTTSLDQRFAALLVLPDGLSGDFIDAIRENSVVARPIVVLDEAELYDHERLPPMVSVTRDFTSALYQVAWAASTSGTI
jgi:hypothetical protein